MTSIAKTLMVYGRSGKCRAEALLTTVASRSFVHTSVARELGTTVELPKPRTFRPEKAALKVRKGMVVELGIGRHRIFHMLLIADVLMRDIIIGNDFLQVWHIRLDPRTRRILLDPKALRLKAVGGRHRP